MGPALKLGTEPEDPQEEPHVSGWKRWLRWELQEWLFGEQAGCSLGRTKKTPPAPGQMDAGLRRQGRALGWRLRFPW